jgi:Protein of unknown function (DUF1573)
MQANPACRSYQGGGQHLHHDFHPSPPLQLQFRKETAILRPAPNLAAIMLRYGLALALGLAFAGTATASTWADSLFDELSRDFGAVPHGPTLTHPFRVVNRTNATVQIASVRVSCGCTTARILQSTLAPGQETAVVIEMDTRRFVGTKSVTIYVQFSQPKFDEVRLVIQANSREDVYVLPETLAFGKIKRGVTDPTSATVTFLGNQNLQITGVSCDTNYVQLGFEQLRRSAGEVSYKLTAAMRPDAPVGKWFTDVWIQNNNPASPRIRVPLTVEIEAPLTVSPMTVGLGEVKAGKLAERKVIVRGVRPFRIVSIQGTDKELSVHDNTSESKTVHVLTVTLQPQHAGELRRTLRVLTDLPDEEAVEFSALAQVVQ